MCCDSRYAHAQNNEMRICVVIRAALTRSVVHSAHVGAGGAQKGLSGLDSRVEAFARTTSAPVTNVLVTCCVIIGLPSFLDNHASRTQRVLRHSRVQAFARTTSAFAIDLLVTCYLYSECTYTSRRSCFSDAKGAAAFSRRGRRPYNDFIRY